MLGVVSDTSITAIVQPLNFAQLLIVLGIIGSFIFGMAAFLTKKGFSFKRKNNSISFGSNGEEIKLSEQQAQMVFLILQTVRIKDTIFFIEKKLFRKQRKTIKEVITKVKENLLQSFKELYNETSSEDLDKKEILADTDYIMFSFLLDRLYNTLMEIAMEDIEQNGLGTIENIPRYSSQRATLLFEKIKEVFLTFYYGINTVERAKFIMILNKNEEEIENSFKKMFEICVKMAQKAHAEKEKLEDQLLGSIIEAYKIDEKTIEKIFSQTKAQEDIDLNI